MRYNENQKRNIVHKYRTLDCVGATYDLIKANAGNAIRWVEEALIKSGKFSLPGKKKLAEPTIEYEVIVVDTTETPIQRPKKNQRDFYSGKKTAEISSDNRPQNGIDN